MNFLDFFLGGGEGGETRHFLKKVFYTFQALEKEVNTGFSHLLSESDNAGDKYGMLGLQIKKLMCCYDVLLEAWQQQGSEAKVDFQREKMFLHSVR